MTNADKGIGNITYAAPMVELLPEMRAAIVACVREGRETLPEEIADIFTLKILVGYNEDGSNRGILDWA